MSEANAIARFMLPKEGELVCIGRIELFYAPERRGISVCW